jgi:hypothetical protein
MKAVLLSLTLLAAACTAPPSPTPTPSATPLPPTAVPTETPSPTSVPATPTPAPTATPIPQVAVDIRLFNALGPTEVQVDGRTVQPGRVMVSPGRHQVAAVADDTIVALADAPPEGGSVDLVARPPLSPLAVVVENSPDARPQSGLDRADVVYETLAEGGISRFLSLYLTGDAPVVGPVRSLRHYFAFIAGDYGADLVHIGASPQGFAWRDAMQLGKLDESAGDPGVWRVRNRFAPHNAYTATAADRVFLSANGRQQGGSWGPLRWSPSAPRGDAAAESISIVFRPSPYNVSYTWDAESGHYARTMQGAPHWDAETGERIAPTTVVVQFAEIQPIPGDEKGRVDIDLVGANGRLLIFSDGTQREGSWKKTAPRASTQWLDSDGQTLIIPPGQVWVELVPLTAEVSAG